jgi:uncharacterized protein
MPTNGADLIALDDYLMSEESPEDSMLISDLDGFLTGLAVSPDLILPSEWMPVIWRGEEPRFADKAEADRIMGAITARYNEILSNLDAGQLDPVFEAWDGTTVVTDWAAGFLDAAMLRPDTWVELIRHDVMVYVFYPMLLLGADDDEKPPFGAPPASEDAMDALLEAGPDIIVECVFRIREHWQSLAGAADLRVKPARRRNRPSRRR